jgi:xylan 1,4-beta-xylosidase
MRKQPTLDAPRQRVRPGIHRSLRAHAALATAAMGLVILTSGRTASAAAYTITVDVARQTAGNPRFWSASVGTGTASLTLRADLQTHYKLLNRELGMQRVRGHGVLNDDIGIYRAAGSYDWTKFDTYLDAIVSAGMRPIMELSFMPTALGLTGSSRDFPKDITAYRQFIQAVVQHCVDKYGAGDVGQWYWEVWNEPDYPGFWNGMNATEAVAAKMTDYYALYDAAVDGATAVIPNILIGGPATTEPSKIAAFLQHCRTANKRVTFVSSHVYPGGNGTAAANATNLVNDNVTRLGQITSGGFTTATVKSFNTEWNSAYSGQGNNPGDANLSMDNHWNAGFILKGVKLLSDRNQGETPVLDVFSYWVASDVFDESSGPSGSYILGQGGNLPFGRVFGLMTFQGVRKAAFNAFKMLNYLGPKRLMSGGGTGADGVDAMATMSANSDELQILVYNYFATLNTTGSDTVTVNVSNLPATLAGKELFVTHFRVDETHSNPYSIWVSQGSPTNPSEAQWQAMRQAQHLALLQPVSKATVTTTYTTNFTIPRQAGSLVIVGVNRPVTGRNALVEIEGEDYDGQSGATRQDSSDTGLGQSIVANSGSSVYFENVDLSDAGVTAVQLRVAAQSDATLELHADAATGPLLGTCAVTATAGAWATQTCMLTQAAGVHRLYVLFGGTVRLNWMKFQGAVVGPGTGATGGAAGPGGVGTGGTGISGGGGESGGMSTGGSNGTGNTGNTVGPGTGGNFGSGGSAPSVTGSGKSSGCACDIGDGGWPSGTLLIGGLLAAAVIIRRRAVHRPW